MLKTLHDLFCFKYQSLESFEISLTFTILLKFTFLMNKEIFLLKFFKQC